MIGVSRSFGLEAAFLTDLAGHCFTTLNIEIETSLPTPRKPFYFPEIIKVSTRPWHPDVRHSSPLRGGDGAPVCPVYQLEEVEEGAGQEAPGDGLGPVMSSLLYRHPVYPADGGGVRQAGRHQEPELRGNNGEHKDRGSAVFRFFNFHIDVHY